VIGQGDAPDTVTTIATRLKNAINANPLIPVTASNVAGVITLVADEAGIDFHTSVSASVSGAITTAVTVANVNPFGRPEDLEAMGVPSDLIDQSATYNAVRISYWGTADSTTQQPKCKCYVLKECWVFVEDGGAAESDILTGANALQAILAGSTSGALTLGDYIGKQSTFCS
jgi:predicted aconitase